jgi:GDP-L-fucose synthase
VAKRNEKSTVEVWGTGDPKREFLHVDDFACACVYLLENYSAALPIHVRTGTEISMRDLAELIGEVVRFDRPFHFNTSKPNGNTAEVP